jgi:hypothetical protein
MKKIYFSIIELTGFILPAFPDALSIRLSILFIYFIAHCFKLQLIYSKMKSNSIISS